MRILLAVDGSSPSLLAARFVRRLYHELKEASVVVVHVHGSGGEEEGRRVAAEATALLAEDSIPFDLEVGPGEAADMIVERAQQHHCDMIVMGARGLGGIRGAVLGSVSAKVSQSSGIPVTLVS
jgi:nucleotide-binding universal stress UspA family protein